MLGEHIGEFLRKLKRRECCAGSPTHAGKKSIDYADYPPEKAPYAMRDVEYVIRCGRENCTCTVRGRDCGIAM